MNVFNQLTMNKLTYLLCFFTFNAYATNFNCYDVYDSTDITAELQAALDSDYDTITIPYMGVGNNWITGPLIFNKSNKTLIIADSVVIEAKSDAFTDTHAFLFTIEEKSNIHIIGDNATFRMKIDEYLDGEWRHCISICSCDSVYIEGVYLERSGGDKIYLGITSSGNTNNNITIKNVTCNGNARQGISIISGKHILIDGCSLKNTGQYNSSGLASSGPFAGIDFEPNNADEMLQDIIVRNCTFENNRRRSVLFAFSNFDDSSDSVSISLENNTITSDDQNGIFFAELTSAKLQGQVKITHTTVSNTHENGLIFRNWRAGNLDVIITDCNIDASNISYPIYFKLEEDRTYNSGNISISESNIHSLSDNAIAVKLDGGSSSVQFQDISVNIDVDNSSALAVYNQYYENVSINLNTGTIDKEYLLEQVKIYPIPVSNELNITNISDAVATIYSVAGTEIFRVALKGKNSTVNVSNLKRGIYLIKIDKECNSIITKFSKM